MSAICSGVRVWPQNDRPSPIGMGIAHGPADAGLHAYITRIASKSPEKSFRLGGAQNSNFAEQSANLQAQASACEDQLSCPPVSPEIATQSRSSPCSNNTANQQPVETGWPAPTLRCL